MANQLTIFIGMAHDDDKIVVCIILFYLTTYQVQYMYHCIYFYSCQDLFFFIFKGSENMPDAGRILPKRAKLHELKEKLQSLTSCRKMSPYERLRNNVLDTLHKHFSLLLVCPLSRPLHEIFFFNNLAAIKDQIRAAPRCSIQHALTQPGKFLNCPCCQCDADAILPSMPDICIVYKLHLECGTLVNLYDWLQAFVTVISSNENGVGKRNSKPSIELRARFIRAVSELQFLGFIKSTQRKTDHVTRLTW